MIKEYFHKYKYYIGGTLLFLIFSFIYGIYTKNLQNNKEEIKKEEIKKETKIIDKNDKKENQINKDELLLISKMFQKEMNKSMNSLITFAKSEIERFENKKYSDFSKEAFQKDVIKKNILIDTISINEENKDTSNYKIKFGKGKFTEKFRNVIGFRLINFLIPNIYIRVNENNNIIKYKLNNGSLLEFVIPPSAYTFETLGDVFQTVMRQQPHLLGIIVESDISTYKYSIKNIPSGKELNFLWKSSNNAAYKLFGATSPPSDDIIISNDYTFPNPSDQSIHFIDVVVDEIPNIACKINSTGKRVLDRIPLYYPSGSLSFYRTPEGDIQSKNFFYPIDLSSLTIKLYDDFGNFYKNDNLDHFMEFEITILENESLV